MSDTRVYFNPRCSKCRTLRGMLEERGIEADYFEYLERAPSLEELERAMAALGLSDARGMMRTKEPLYAELGLDGADRSALLQAMLEHPVLIERPILLRGGRAVIARPPEKALDLL